MNNQLRYENGWMQAALWLVAAAFAAFLIGLGGNVLDRLRDTAPTATLNQFIDPIAGARVQASLRQGDSSVEAARTRLAQARHRHNVARSNTTLARENFDVWASARSASARPDQDTELIVRTDELNQVITAEQAARNTLVAEEQTHLLATQQREQADKRWRQLESAAMVRLEEARKAQQMHMFLYRLAVTLPLVLLACWLFARHRGSTWWPFVWGYIGFAAFTFFAELMPYVPSYGGYVRYIIGIAVTVLVGRFAIQSLQREREPDPDPEPGRQEAVCPGCAFAIDSRAQQLDFCGHCGTHLFTSCAQCKTRKVASARFCTACGAPDGVASGSGGARQA